MSYPRVPERSQPASMQLPQQIADITDPKRIRPDGAFVRPDGFIPPEPPPVHPPVDNSGAPPEVLADHEQSMDDEMNEMGVSMLGGFTKPYLMEGQPVRRPGT